MDTKIKNVHILSWLANIAYCIVILSAIYFDFFSFSDNIVDILSNIFVIIVFSSCLVPSVNRSLWARVVVLGLLCYYIGNAYLMTFCYRDSVLFAVISAISVSLSVLALIFSLTSIDDADIRSFVSERIPKKTIVALFASYLMLMYILTIISIVYYHSGMEIFPEGSRLKILLILIFHPFGMRIGLPMLFALAGTLIQTIIYGVVIAALLRNKPWGLITSLMLLVALAVPVVFYCIEFIVFVITDMGILHGPGRLRLLDLIYHVVNVKGIIGIIASLVAGKILFGRKEEKKVSLAQSEDKRAPVKDVRQSTLHFISGIASVLLLYFSLQFEQVWLSFLIILFFILIIFSVRGSKRARLLMAGFLVYFIYRSFMGLFVFDHHENMGMTLRFFIFVLYVAAFCIDLKILDIKNIEARFSKKTPVSKAIVVLFILSLIAISYWAVIVQTAPHHSYYTSLLDSLFNMDFGFEALFLIVLYVGCIIMLYRRSAYGYLLASILLTVTTLLWGDMFNEIFFEILGAGTGAGFFYDINLMLKLIGLYHFSRLVIFLPSLLLGIFTVAFIMNLNGKGKEIDPARLGNGNN